MTPLLTTLIDAALKGSALLTLGFVLTLAIRRSTASFRYAIWISVFAAMLLLPWLSEMLPRWNVLLHDERKPGRFTDACSPRSPALP